jgi:mono/diheme cytochrome c family protein
MKTILKVLKWTGIVLGVVVVGLVITVLSMYKRTFDAPYPNNIKASTDSAVIARGAYLVYGPAHCGNCHSPMENQEAINRGEHLPLSGGFTFALPIGNIYSPNITPDEETGIGKLTDAQLARALRHGVGHDGRALFDFMPFQHLSHDDLTAVISYLRSQPAVKHKVPERDLNFLGKAITAFVIKPVGQKPGVEIPQSLTPDTSAAYGSYLANYVANCNGCHTERDLKTGAYIGESFAGGTAFPSAVEEGSICVSPNLTPDSKTGRIYEWSEQVFVDRFRKPRVYKASEMPWELFSRMTDNDLKAIYKYLHTLKPVTKDVGPTYIPAPKKA